MFKARNRWSPSSHRSGFKRNHSFTNKPSSNGNSNIPKRFWEGRNHQSKLGNNVDMFIRKAEGIVTNTTYTPQTKFENLKISEILKENILNHGYTQPTPIQDKAINPIIEGRDVIGIANTGTGKTAAFLIPLIDKVFKNNKERVLIIVPTRELAQQINEELHCFSAGMSIRSAVVIGGASLNRQKYDVTRNPDFVIATPGRLKDLMQRRIITLKDFSVFILDEVDLMVDIGFIHDIKYFISFLPKERQSLFFSATIPQKVNQILQPFVRNPITVSVKQQDTAENIDQDIVRVISKEKKVEQLHDLLIQEGFDKVLIFGRTKHGIEKLNKELITRGFKVGSIHGNKTQNYRQRILESFKRSEIQILLATDVASRGLDIENVTHVINYDLPENYEDYIHRIGRTGRANKKGQALTFVE